MKLPKTTLQGIRCDKDMSVRELASKVGVSPSYYSDIESNRAVPGLLVGRRLQNYFGIPLDKLLAPEESN